MTKIDIISGFLGAGKTTFANLLLSYYIKQGLRPVYIVNEFGDIGLDAQIIKTEGFEAVEIAGGCICCTLKTNLADTLQQVIETFSPSIIVFEPSGIFVFDNFKEILMADGLRNRCCIEHVFTIVDSINFSFSMIAHGSFISNQIKNSPVVILSKLEKLKKAPDEIICDVKNISPDTKVIAKPWATWNDKDFDSILQTESAPQMNHSLHKHNHFESITIPLKKEFSNELFLMLIQGCKEERFGNIYRVKGVVKIEGASNLVNIARNDASISVIKGIFEPSLTFIGESLDKIQIDAFFNSWI